MAWACFEVHSVQIGVQSNELRSSYDIWALHQHVTESRPDICIATLLTLNVSKTSVITILNKYLSAYRQFDLPEHLPDTAFNDLFFCEGLQTQMKFPNPSTHDVSAAQFIRILNHCAYFVKQKRAIKSRLVSFPRATGEIIFIKTAKYRKSNENLPP